MGHADLSNDREELKRIAQRLRLRVVEAKQKAAMLVEELKTVEVKIKMLEKK